VRLWRAHALGNDYLVLESGEALSPELVRAICDRHRGAGSDGILEPVGTRGVRIHNPDGSVAERSGNGLRIFALWLGRRHGTEEVQIDGDAGPVRCRIGGSEVSLVMGPATVGAAELLDGRRAWPVDVGNPHRVFFDVPSDWREVGARVERAVPGRTNVQFVAIEEGVPSIRIWERGAGETASSGTSACAVAAVCVARGLATSPVTVRMPGGDVRVHVGDTLVLEGPVEPVGTIEMDATWCSRRS
jgi:diaminopimelate epimerase